MSTPQSNIEWLYSATASPWVAIALAPVPKQAAEILLARLAAVPKGEQGRVAGLAGLSPNHLSRWLNKEVPFNPKLDTLQLLAVALDKPLPVLLTDPDEQPAGAHGPTARDLSEAARLLLDALALVRGEKAAPTPRPAPDQPTGQMLKKLRSARASSRKRKGKTRQGGEGGAKR